jgi:hypothetical protein
MLLNSTASFHDLRNAWIIPCFLATLAADATAAPPAEPFTYKTVSQDRRDAEAI